MKKVRCFLIGMVILTHCSSLSYAQISIAYSPVIDSLVGLIDNSTVALRDRQLSGDTSVFVNGTTQTITTRNYLYNDVQEIATQFVLDKFLEYGYDARYQDYSSTGRNVLGWKTGTKFPDKKYIICAHYDDMPTASLAPGADDNASGVVAVMEAARVLAGFNSQYTIEFAIWDEEEIGLVGSAAYADSAAANGDQILGVLNFDMIAWDSNNDFVLTLGTNTQSQILTNEYQDVMQIYTPEFSWNYTTIEASDHASFWHHNYPALLAIEDYPGDFNAYYHTPEDNFSNINLPYFTRMVQAATAGIASEAWNCRLSLQHQPVQSGCDTLEQTALLTVLSPRTIPATVNQPRLYFAVNEGAFQFVYPNEINGNSYKFTIPAQPNGTTVKYYFAVQDAEAVVLETLPKGGRGVNPPGSVAPDTFFSYLVSPVSTQMLCSQSGSQTIPDKSVLYDTINCDIYGGIKDIDVSLTIHHTRVATLAVSLISPDGTIIDLSSGNGGSGSDFIATTFDDEALISIKNGSAPFTGRFKPEQALSTFDTKNLSGNWVLKIEDQSVSQVGALENWCLTFTYFDPTVSVSELHKYEMLSLRQNFPNPVTDVTHIPFTLTESARANIQLFDIYGRLVKEISDEIYSEGNHIIQTDLSLLKPGPYFLKLHVGNNALVKVILKN